MVKPRIWTRFWRLRRAIDWLSLKMPASPRRRIFLQKGEPLAQSGFHEQRSRFQFYPGKNLGACGEGGAVTTNDEGIARTVRMIRDHGQSKKYYHDIEGYNGRLDSIQAGLLRVKLKHLPRWNQQRVECAQRYNELLATMSGSITLPFQPKWSKHVYHLYVVRTPRREELQTHLNEAGIGTGIHYPIPVHMQRAYDSMGWKRGDFPSPKKRSEQILSLPMYGGLRSDQQRRVADMVAEFASIRSTV